MRGRRAERPSFDALPLALSTIHGPASAPGGQPVSERRKSWSVTRSTNRNASAPRRPTVSVETPESEETSDHDDGFERKVQINMKGLVGDAVGSVRDPVLSSLNVD
jgi:hypothetical protein